MIETGNVDPRAILAQLEHADAATIERVQRMLEDAGATEVGSGAPLNIADYYRDGPAKYDQRWPIASSLAGFTFDDLDRKTQFFVLFNEWTRRELEGMGELNAGHTDGAETIFAECVERARQLDVSELLARSYEGLMRVAQKRGDAAAEAAWSAKAVAARRTR
jgi:hypothetical protein